MTKPIEHALIRTLTAVLAVLTPPTRRRRSPTGRAARTACRATYAAPPRESVPADDWPQLVEDPRSPRRQRVIAYERQSRRTALSLALDGIDVGPWVIHGHRIGSRATATGVATR